jgi:hypothetical protein
VRKSKAASKQSRRQSRKSKPSTTRRPTIKVNMRSAEDEAQGRRRKWSQKQFDSRKGPAGDVAGVANHLRNRVVGEADGRHADVDLFEKRKGTA